MALRSSCIYYQKQRRHSDSVDECNLHVITNPPHIIYSNNLLLVNLLQYILWIPQKYLLSKECVYFVAILLPGNYSALLPTPSLPAGRAGFPSACVWPFCLLVLDKYRRCCGLAWPAPWLSKVLLFCKSFSAVQPRDPVPPALSKMLYVPDSPY